MLKNKNAKIRQAAVYSIRIINNPNSVPYLLEGLDDIDNEVKYHCVMTLAKLFGKGGEYGPSHERFSGNEEKTVSLWKDWIKQQQN